jgi:uncharacterized lipoprotein YmbA
MLRKLFILLAVFVMAACSMPATKIYSIHLPDSVKAKVKKQATITVKIQSPRYLTQPYIAQRTSEYQLDISRYEKWDSSPSEMVRETFRDSLSAIYDDVRASTFVPEGSYVLTINLKHFERVDEGYGQLAFSALFSSAEGRELYRFEADKKMVLDTKDPAGLAKSLSSALSESVKDVVGNISSKL